MSNLPIEVEQSLEPTRVRQSGDYIYQIFAEHGDLNKCMIRRVYQPDENVLNIDWDYPNGQSQFSFKFSDYLTYNYLPKKD